MVKTFHDHERAKELATTTPTTLTPRTFYEQELLASQPKPLFTPRINVEDAISPTQHHIIEAACQQLDLQEVHFTDAEISRILLLQHEIDLKNPNVISHFGQEANQFSENVLTELSQLIHNRHVGDIQTYLQEILTYTRRVHINSLITGSVSWWLRLSDEAVYDKNTFKRLDNLIQHRVAACLPKLEQLNQAQHIFSQLLEKTELQFRSLTLHIVAGQLHLNTAQQQLAHDAMRPSHDFLQQQERIDQQEAYQRFQRRLHTLTLLRHTVMLRMAQLRLEQKNIYSLIDQANEIIHLVIPSWRQQILALLSTTNSEQLQQIGAALIATQQKLADKLSAKG